MIRVAKQSLSPKDLRTKWIKLLIFVSPIFGAYFYSNTSYNSPLFCPIKALTGIPCPSCGMTRSFLAIATGNLPESLEYHIFGIVLFIGCLMTVIHFSLEITIKRNIRTFYSRFIGEKNNLIILLMLLLSYYIIRLYYWGISGELITDFQNSPLAHFLNKY
jgi:hypothetical protein